jgi:hypothetical protein
MRSLSAAGSMDRCITVRWTRPANNASYRGWVGLDLFNLCRRSTLNITVIPLGRCWGWGSVPEDPWNPLGGDDIDKEDDCLISVCQDQTNNCILMSNTGKNNCCIQLSVITVPSINNDAEVIGLAPDRTVRKCFPKTTKIIGFSWITVDCNQPNTKAPEKKGNLNQRGGATNEHAYGVYPSPANDKLNLAFPAHFEGETSVMIYDISGKLMFQKIFVDNIGTEISTKDWLAGIYLVKSSNKQGQLSQKIMIQH